MTRYLRNMEVQKHGDRIICAAYNLVFEGTECVAVSDEVAEKLLKVDGYYEVSERNQPLDGDKGKSKKEATAEEAEPKKKGKKKK